jgi:hypothetical protein
MDRIFYTAEIRREDDSSDSLGYLNHLKACTKIERTQYDSSIEIVEQKDPSISNAERRQLRKKWKREKLIKN